MKRKRHPWDAIALFAVGLAIISFGLAYYLSPLTRMEIYGVKLVHRVAMKGRETFLVGWESNVDAWTERAGRLDTPLLKQSLDEVSTVLVDRIPGTSTENRIVVKPKEWIRSLNTQEGFKNLTLPLNHPSIAPETVIMDKEGTLLQRLPGSAWRMERVVEFLLPQFPKGPLRIGSSWTERLDWPEIIADWQILWKADVRWSLKGFEEQYGRPCARLIYEGTLTPQLRRAAYWASGAGQVPEFTGTARGEALYDVKDRYLISNTFSYKGAVRIHVPDLSRVPEDLRVGLGVSEGEKGDVVMDLKDKIDIRLP